MDNQQPNEQVNTSPQELFRQILTSKSEITGNEVSVPDSSALDKIWEQRRTQRDDLFKFAIGMSNASFIFLVGLIICNIFTKLGIDKNFELFSSSTLQILAVSILTQILGIVAIIARAIWDDKNYRNMLRDDHHKKHG